MPALPFRQNLAAGLLVVAPSILSFALPGALTAQTILTVSPQQCVWRSGDNPAWAAPNLDESGWQPYAQFPLSPDQPRFWIRCRLNRAAFRNLDHPAVQIRMLIAYEAFFNGVSFARNGNLESGNFGMNSIRVFPIPLPMEHDPDVLAMRVVQRYAALVTPPEVRLGDEQALANDRAGYLLGTMPSALLQNLPFIVIGIVSLVLLPFSLSERSRLGAILLGVTNVAAAVVFLDVLCVALMLNEPVWLSISLGGIAGAVSFFTQFWFPFALARRRVPAVFWIPMSAWSFSAAWPIVEVFVPLQVAFRLDGIRAFVLTPVNYGAAALLGAAPLVAFWPWNRIPRPMRAIAWFSLAWGMSQTLFFTAVVTTLNIPGIPNVFQGWMFPASTVAQVFVIAAIIALILRDQRHIALQRASLAGEMRAASEIQQMLAPAVIETAPGLRIDVAFHPMRDVGGDFYLCRVLSDGRQRVLLGDVSGKGAAAAMAATLLLGAAAARESDSPAGLLSHLNRVLRENHLSGFATCLCADVATNGRLTLANAGHLPPYRDGREIEFDSGLPLGIASESEYGETTLRLDPGAQLTLLSDGIVEARSTQGELFGFDRTQAISSQSAESISQAARAFGQEDDITVLTLKLLSADSEGMPMGEQVPIPTPA
ncbi:MAG: SpoIIE family protein phosphatase [Terracidiphilus sp.]